MELNDFLKLKKQAGELRDKSLQAKATMIEVEKNITNLKEELKELGIKNLDAVDDEIAKFQEKVDKLYTEAEAKISKWL